jgi:hypothetical protein
VTGGISDDRPLSYRLGYLIEQDTGWCRTLVIEDQGAAWTPRGHRWEEVHWGTQLYGSRYDVIIANRLPQTEREKEWWGTSVLCRLAPHGKLVVL